MYENKKIFLFGAIVLFFLLSIVQVNASGTLINGITSYWNMTNATGTTTLDATGYDTQTATNSAIWKNWGIFSPSIFPANTYYTKGTSVDTKTQYKSSTIAINLWFNYSGNIADYDQADELIQSDLSNCGSYAGYTLQLKPSTTCTESTIRFDSFRSTSAPQYVSTCANLSAGLNMITIIRNITYEGLFVNGALISTNITDAFRTPFGANCEIDIGGRDGGGQLVNKGFIDEVGFWNRTLTATEITSLYNSGAGCLYPFTNDCSAVVQNPLAIVNQTYPANPSQFNINTSLFFWATANTSEITNISLYIDNVQQTPTQSANPSYNGLYNFTGIALSETNHTWFIQWKNLTDSRTINSTISTIYIDLSNPTIATNFTTGEVHNIYNSSDVITGTFNFSDNQILYKINVTVTNTTGFATYNYQNTSLGNINFTTFAMNLQTNNYGIGRANITWIVCDGHTAETIDDMQVDNFADQLLFTDNKEQQVLITTAENTGLRNLGERIVQTGQQILGQQVQQDWNAEKNDDRYKFTYSPTGETEKTFIVTTTEPQTILENNEYGQWIVAGDHWIDFVLSREQHPEYSVWITQLDDYNSEVHISDLNPDVPLEFQSIGSLNCITSYYYWQNINISESHDSEIVEGSYATYNYTIYRDNSTTTNAYLSLANTQYNATKTSTPTYAFYNVTVLQSLINASVMDVANDMWVWNATNGTTLSGNFTFSQRIEQMLISNCSKPYNSTAGYDRSVNFTVLDADTFAPIPNATASGTFTLWSADPSLNRSTGVAWDYSSNGNFALCLFPNATVNMSYVLQYSAIGYTANILTIVNTVINKTQQYVSLLLTAGVNNVVINVIDQLNHVMVNYLLQVYKYTPATLSYNLSSAQYTDYAGNILFNYVTSTGYRVYIYNTTGQLVFDTGLTHFVTNPTVIKIGSPPVITWFNNTINQTYYAFNYSVNNTGNATFQSISDNIKNNINPFYRFLLALLLSLIAGLCLVHFIGPIGAGFIVLLVLCGFAMLGWISWIYPIILGILTIGGFVGFSYVGGA